MVCLTWNPPPEERQNGVIISYTISCTDNELIVKGHVRSYCIDFRLGGQPYDCSILASTAVGDGPSTSTISVTTEGKALICGFI